MELNIAKSVAQQLRAIIDQAITSGEVDPESLRMILLVPNGLFDTLQVVALEEWDAYYHMGEEEQGIGDISIAEWLDVADEAFEKRDTLSDTLVSEAIKHGERYQKKSAAIEFNHITHLLYKSFLVCLREALVSQIEEALKIVAVSYSQEDFSNVVGFAAHHLRFADERRLHIQGFNHPHGTGPFYKVRLDLPQTKLTYPYLNFYDSGFFLYYPKGNMFEEPDAQSVVYQYDVSDFNYVILSSGNKREPFTFRLIDEFDDWELQGGHIEEDEGDFSEAVLLQALNELFIPHPEKILDKNRVPHPITDGTGFEKWIENMVANNLAISADQKEKILAYGEAAFRKMLELLPETHKSHEGALEDLAQKLFEQDRFEESLAVLKSIKKQTDHTKVHLLENLYYLGQKEEFDQLYISLENKKAQKDALLLKWLFDLSLCRTQTETLLTLELEICAFIKEHKAYVAGGRAALALTKLYLCLNETEKALYHFQEIPFFYDIDRVLFLKEFDQVPFLMEVYRKKVSRDRERKRLSEQFKSDALVIPEEKSDESENVYYEHCYRSVFKNEDLQLKWAHPLSAQKFIGVNDNNELFLAEFSDSYELLIHQALQLENQRLKSYAYHEGILYLVDSEAGIIRYHIDENTIRELEGQYRNTKVPNKYESVALSDGYLYTCNNESLEIFDLSQPVQEPVSSELFIESGYSLFINEQLLVVGAGAGLVLLVDVSDKKNPRHLSSIMEARTPDKMHVEFIDKYMVSLSVVDISDPRKPQYVCDNKKKLAPIYYFTEKPPFPLFCIDDEYPFRTLAIDTNKTTKIINWFGFLDTDLGYQEQIASVLATSFCGDSIIAFSEYGIRVFEKIGNPLAGLEVFNAQEEIHAMVYECFEALVEQRPDFSIGKVVLQCQLSYGMLLFSFQECSSPAVLASSLNETELPMVKSMFNIYGYFKSVHGKDFNPETMSVRYDGAKIIDQLLKDPRFVKMAARHVSIVIDASTTYLEFTGHGWHPYRKSGNTKDITSTEGILLSENENLLKKLTVQMNEDAQVLEDLLRIINKVPPKAPKSSHLLSDMYSNTMVDSAVPAKSSYVHGPTFNSDRYEKDVQELGKQKQEAFKILCAHKDRTLLKNTLLNALKYDIVRPSLGTTPHEYSPSSYYLNVVIYNLYGLLDEFAQDPEFKTFLLDQLNTLNETEQLRLVYHYQLLSHPIISNHIQQLLTDPHDTLDYYKYMDDLHTPIASLPLEVLAPFETQLLEILNQYEREERPEYRLKNMIVPVFDILYRLGHETFPEKILQKVGQAKKNTERYSNDLFEDDYMDEDSFLAKLYREHQVKQILKAFEAGGDSPLWAVAVEPYEHSWNLTIAKILEQGSSTLGTDFGTRFVTQLATNIAGDERYALDRVLAFNFVKYVYKTILKQPNLASLAEILIKAIHEHKELFSDDIDLYSIKEKSKLALLQAAWNDVKNKDLGLAAQKGDILLQMDPAFGQVYFLKARLLWLQEGVQAYLTREDEFINLSNHDSLTLARLYNLTGCALDALKRHEEALPYFKKAALEEPSDPMYVANIAEIYYKLKNPKEAFNYAKKAKANGNTAEILKEIIKNKGIIE